MPRERTRERGEDSPKQNLRSEKNGQLREERSDARIDSLRRIYGEVLGDRFAPGIRGDAHLKTLLKRTGSNSLSDYLKTIPQALVGPKDLHESVNEKCSETRYASDARFGEAHRKTGALHSGLFRRVAE